MYASDAGKVFEFSKEGAEAFFRIFIREVYWKQESSLAYSKLCIHVPLKAKAEEGFEDSMADYVASR